MMIGVERLRELIVQVSNMIPAKPDGTWENWEEQALTFGIDPPALAGFFDTLDELDQEGMERYGQRIWPLAFYVGVLVGREQ